MDETGNYQPNGRCDHTINTVRSNLFMWGGKQKGLLDAHDSEKKRKLTSLIEVFNLTTGKWKQNPTTGNPPLGIIGCASTVVDNNIIYFGGGCGHTGCYHNSLNSLCVDTMTWRELSPTNSNDGPMMKRGCGMIPVKIDGKFRLLLVGGYGPSDNTPRQHDAQYSEMPFSDNVRTNEHHYYDISTDKWSTPVVTGDCPPPSSDFTLTSVSADTFLMFGGYTPSGRTNTVYIGHCTKTTVNWKLISRPPSKPTVKSPKGRSGHTTAAVDENHIIVIGGSPTRDCSDCWLFDIETKLWKELTLPQSITARESHSLSTCNVSPDTLWLIEFGGYRYISDTSVVELISSDDGEWLVGGVMTHPLNDYAEKFNKKRKFVSTPHESISFCDLQAEVEQLRQKLQESQLALQQEHEEKQQIQEMLQQNNHHFSQEIQRLCQDNIRLQQESQRVEQEKQQIELKLHQLLQDIQEKEQQVPEFEQIQLNEVTTSESFWVVRKEEIIITEEVLGKGGWGEVKVAKFRGIKVAAKCLHEVIISQYNVSLFAQEMEIAAKVRHPNLLQFIGATRVGAPIILCEWMPISLRKELETGPILYPAVLAISFDVACGLNYLHLFKPHPIIHHDVSSANVLLQSIGGGWKAKLSDYGSANLQPMIGRTVNPCSPVYSAPESNIPTQHSPAMDVFSYGVLLIEMIVCQIPDPSERDHHLNSIQRPTMKNLIDRCLKDDSSQRPTMADIINEFNKSI